MLLDANQVMQTWFWNIFPVCFEVPARALVTLVLQMVGKYHSGLSGPHLNQSSCSPLRWLTSLYQHGTTIDCSQKMRMQQSALWSFPLQQHLSSKQSSSSGFVLYFGMWIFRTKHLCVKGNLKLRQKIAWLLLYILSYMHNVLCLTWRLQPLVWSKIKLCTVTVCTSLKSPPHRFVS